MPRREAGARDGPLPPLAISSVSIFACTCLRLRRAAARTSRGFSLSGRPEPAQFAGVWPLRPFGAQDDLVWRPSGVGRAARGNCGRRRIRRGAHYNRLDGADRLQGRQQAGGRRDFGSAGDRPAARETMQLDRASVVRVREARLPVGKREANEQRGEGRGLQPISSLERHRRRSRLTLPQADVKPGRPHTGYLHPGRPHTGHLHPGRQCSPNRLGCPGVVPQPFRFMLCG